MTQKSLTREWLLAAYYTPDYKALADIFVDSAIKSNVTFHVEPIECKGSWDANTYYKPEFILSCIDKYKDKNIVYVDIDARVMKYPELFDMLDCDMAFWRVKQRYGNYISNGTIFINNNEKSKKVIEEWRDSCNTISNELEQIKFTRIIDNSDLKTELLPIEYCQIFDYPDTQIENGVIVHYQASRKYKEMLNGR